MYTVGAQWLFSTARWKHIAPFKIFLDLNSSEAGTASFSIKGSIDFFSFLQEDDSLL
jgi:hypothetical protein